MRITAEDGGATAGLANNRCFPASLGLVAKPCDCCNSAPALLFCRTDSAYMCMTCDAKIHGPNKIGSAHERVWMCEVCEQAPASVACKADAAALCDRCDRDIHSINHLARRHERLPVVPFYVTAESVVKSTATAFSDPPPVISNLEDDNDDNNNKMANATCTGHDFKSSACIALEYDTSDLWISSISMNSKVVADATNIKSTEFLFSDTDNYLDFDGPISLEDRFQQRYTSGTDGVVPVQTTKNQFLSAQLPGGHHHSSEKYLEIDFIKSNISLNSYPKSYAACVFSQSVSTSSLDVGIVPDGGSMSEISYPIGKNLSSSAGDSSGSSSGANNQGSQLDGMDREARVLRYRERRKNRKFEKTIRYASRKAYAEMRPRIKGRFAKRTEAVGRY